MINILIHIYMFRFYFHDLSRCESEILLLGQKTGAFLIRFNSYYEAFIISFVNDKGKVDHCFISQDNNKFYSINHYQWFTTLHDLIRVFYFFIIINNYYYYFKKR
jgi:hypothetical protein